MISKLLIIIEMKMIKDYVELMQIKKGLLLSLWLRWDYKSNFIYGLRECGCLGK